jgi:hypothetical protein
MRFLLALAVISLATGSPLAAGEIKPNGLTPAELADGWLLLFDGETTFGWKIDGAASAKDGTLMLGKGTAATFTTTLDSFELRFESQRQNASAKAPLLELVGANMTRRVELSSGSDWSRHAVTCDAESRSMQIRFRVAPEDQLSLRNVKVRPLGLKPILNGKDLTGWKEHPGKRSRFSVNSKGELNVKDGPGDLQTEGRWADFVLQLECISNGKHLNSGVFFRCRPGEYQQGYEAQIHNGFGDQPKVYTLEDYDPQTHKLIGKRKEKFHALDYGTGAIYRRMPARKQMAKDHEWFPMTVVARGRRFAVWVSGVQVTDWTDNRPLADNARNGCMLEKGAISLQGHDPTTNLSFRNFRLAEFRADKTADAGR